MKKAELPPPSKDLYQAVLARLQADGRTFAWLYRRLNVARGSAIHALVSPLEGPVARRLRRRILRRVGLYGGNGAGR